MTKIAFVCIHNSCRSQMAEAWAKKLAKDDNLEIYSAGTEIYPRVKPMAIEVMREAGVSMEGQHPKLMEDIPQDLDYVITMGCEVECPYLPGAKTEDWNIADPSLGTIDDFIATRDQIKEKVEDLLKRI